MKIDKKEPPRRFSVGKDGKIMISDCGKIYLSHDEQITFVTKSGKEHDFTAKSWGFYATPSVNGRLIKEGFKTALVKNKFGKYYIMIVDPEHMSDFDEYLNKESNEVVEWLDER